MNCPRCGNKMEAEHSREIVDTSYPPGTGKTISTSLYRCDECDCEWVWRMGVKGIRMIDGAIYRNS